MTMLFTSFAESQVKEMLMTGKVGIIPTDTLYGFHCLAINKQSVERIYGLKDRNQNKPFIVLISALTDLSVFGIDLTVNDKTKVMNFWPGPYSIILPCGDAKFEYLHRGTKALAFRMPRKENLLALLAKTGPLVSTSVNRAGALPAKSFDEAYADFGDVVDFYINEGKLDNPPSTVFKFDGDALVILRK